MTNGEYKLLIKSNMMKVQCCLCGKVVGYKDAERDLTDGDLVISHTYCAACAKSLMGK